MGIPSPLERGTMPKTVLIFTISTALWILPGSVMAQGSRPAAGPVANGLLMNVPAVAPLNRPAAVAFVHSPKLVDAAPGPSSVAQGIAQGSLGHQGLAMAENKKSAALARLESAAATNEPPRVIPTCQ